ncbi:hypothetical protein ACFVIM_28615 [Streptomyces sp. NPDC057638]|uniref:hypothetical protein n=1 Tax=Streptomyces sp. NPDC057638 TaxID=3346190 RepID=UPI0036C0D806
MGSTERSELSRLSEPAASVTHTAGFGRSLCSDHAATRAPLPRDRADALALPGSPLAVDALRHAEERTHPTVFRHSVRGYLYSRALAGSQGLVPGADYDDDPLFVAAVLHDIGLCAPAYADPGASSGPPEALGARLAARFLREWGAGEDVVRVVRNAIAFSGPGDPRPPGGREAALCRAGIAADIGGAERDRLPTGLTARVEAAFPGDELAYAVADPVVGRALSGLFRGEPLVEFRGAPAHHGRAWSG